MITENQSRLTFAELLLTTAIVAVLASLLLPVFAQDRERVGRAASAPRRLSHNCADSLARLEQILRFAQNDSWRGTETSLCTTGPKGQAFWGL